MRLPSLIAIALLASAAAPGAEPAPKAVAAHEPVQPAMPGACPALPNIRAGALPFPTGEALGYTIDVMGAKAGHMTFDVLPVQPRTAEIPVRVRVQSNTFFTKVKNLHGEVVSYLRARDLRPTHFHEDLSEGPLNRVSDVVFGANKVAELSWHTNQQNGASGAGHFAYVGDGLDYVGGIFLFRGIPLKVGEAFCFDGYSLKRMWRVEGRVEAREHVSVPAGEFEAFHLAGVAKSYTGNMKREIHVWISDDARRLPLAAVGVVELGPVRATLTDVQRPDLRTGPDRSSLEW